MTTNTDETFIRTSPPLNRFTVKLGGPAPWDVLTAEDARYYAGLLDSGGRIGSAWRLREYADAVDALTRSEEAS